MHSAKFVLLPCLVSAFACAAEPTWETWALRWAAPEGCIQAAELAERIEGRAGRPLFVSSGRLLIDGVARRQDAGYRFRLTLLDTTGRVLGSRELDSATADCRALDDKVLLVAMLLIQPRLVASTPVSQAPAQQPNAPPMRLEVTDVGWAANGVSISRLGFYRLAGRVDLVERAAWADTSRVMGLIGGATLGVVGGSLLLAHAAGAGCTRSSSGACLDQSPTLLVTGLIVAGAATVLCLWFGLSDAPATTREEDVAIAAKFNSH